MCWMDQETPRHGLTARLWMPGAHGIEAGDDDDEEEEVQGGCGASGVLKYVMCSGEPGCRVVGAHCMCSGRGIQLQRGHSRYRYPSTM